MSMALSPRIFPGALHAANRTACDWGWQGFLAYGCQNFIVILDPNTAQVVQTVHHHLAPICQVKWNAENYYHDSFAPYNLHLAAGNTNGNVMIWDIRQGKLLNDLSEPNKVPICMEWFQGHEVSHSLLLVLYSPSQLVLWNTDTGVRLWKKQFQDNILSVTVDPFDNTKMTLMSTDWIMLVTDLSLTQPPSEKGRKFYMSSNASPASSSTSLTSPTASKSSALSGKSTFSQKFKSRIDDLRGRVEEDSEPVSDCLQAVYLPCNRNIVLLLFPREILCLDVEIGQSLGSFSIEATSPSFNMVIPCRQRDILYLLHDNGSISMRAVRSPDSVPYQEIDDPEQMLTSRFNLEILYDMKCHSDVFRLSRSSRLMGMSLCPVTESHLSILLGDGRILFWDLTASKSSSYTEPSINIELCELQETKRTPKKIQATNLSQLIPPLLTFDERLKSFSKPKFMLNGLFEGVALNPVCLKMCPPMTTKNFNYYQPLVAVGCSNGVLQIFNASKGFLVKYLSMPCHKIKGIEWVTLTTLLVFFQGSSTMNESEIVHVDIASGLIKTLPSSRGLKESQVVLLKVSHLKQYFLVLYKNQMAELWDAINLCQLREFPSKFPTITSFEWSPSNYGSKLGKKKAKAMSLYDNPTSSSGSTTSTNLDESTSTVLDSKIDINKTTSGKTKEHLVFTDGDGTVYHYVVEGTSLKDGSKVPPEAGMNAISYISWKADMLVLGDIDGNLNLWDLKAKVSRVFPTNRGAVKKMKFAPGKGNTRLLLVFNDGIEVWDSAEAKILGTIKTTKDQISILDADWLSSSLPLLLPSDGSIRILDAALKSSNSPVAEKDLDEPVFNPRLIDAEASFKLKHVLQHQRWRDVYDAEMKKELHKTLTSKISISDHREDRPVQDMLSVIPSDVADKLYECRYGTAERCLNVAHIFGDQSDCLFWNVALHYLQREKLRLSCPRHQEKGTSQDVNVKYQKKNDAPQSAPILSRLSSSNSLDDFLLDSDIEENETTDIGICSCLKKSLDANFDLLCDNLFYKKLQLYRIALRDSHRTSYEHTRLCAEKLILTGEMDRAVQVLLEGEPTDTSYYPDALRACLIATVRSSGASQSTIKLVATNLIASGKLSEGVELLCLVDKGVDACRYLQTYGGWNLAAWLAKMILRNTTVFGVVKTSGKGAISKDTGVKTQVRLNHHECNEVMTRWSEQLITSNKKEKDTSQNVDIKNQVTAILILLSIGRFTKVLEIMFSLGQIERATLFLEACLEFQVLSYEEEKNHNLFENIFLDYARLQMKLKHITAAQYYCNKAGGRGKKLWDDFQNGTLKL